MTRSLFIAAVLASSIVGIAGSQAQSGDTKCGPVAYDSAKQTYVGIPCTAGTTDENPAGRSQ